MILTKSDLSTYVAKQQLVILLGAHSTGIETVIKTHRDMPEELQKAVYSHLQSVERLFKTIEAVELEEVGDAAG